MTADKHKPERKVKQKYATFRDCLKHRIPIKVSTNTLAVYKALIKIAYEEKIPWIGNDSGLENIRCIYLLFNTTPGGPYSMEATDSEYHYRTLNVAEYLSDVDLLSEINVDKGAEQVQAEPPVQKESRPRLRELLRSHTNIKIKVASKALCAQFLEIMAEEGLLWVGGASIPRNEKYMYLFVEYRPSAGTGPGAAKEGYYVSGSDFSDPFDLSKNIEYEFDKDSSVTDGRKTEPAHKTAPAEQDDPYGTYWDDVIKNKTPCYFWNSNSESLTVGHLILVRREEDVPYRYSNPDAPEKWGDFEHCQPASTPGTSVKTVRTVPVKEMTWEEAAKCALPCYLWMKNKRGRYSVGLLKGYERGSLGGLPFYGLSAYWDSCKPIDSAIIIVDPPEPAQPEYRPFKTFEELMEAVKEHGDWVDCHSEDGFFRKVSTFQITAGGLRYVNGFNLASDDAGKWTFLDGTPFGVPINKT